MIEKCYSVRAEKRAVSIIHRFLVTQHVSKSKHQQNSDSINKRKSTILNSEPSISPDSLSLLIHILILAKDILIFELKSTVFRLRT